MLKNYFKVAFRNLRTNPGYTFINILGLAIGLTCFILIMAYIHYELSFDRFHEKAGQTYRVVHEQPDNVFLGTHHFAVTPAPLEQAILADFPEVDQATILAKRNLILSGRGQFFDESGITASPSFFNVFTFPLSDGDPETALLSPNSIVLGAALAKKMFGEENPMGKTVTRNDGTEFTVTGLMPDIPKNSHFSFDFITPVTSDENYIRDADEWRNSGWYTYIVLKNGASAEQLEAKLPEFISRYSPNDYTYYLQPLSDIHLRSHINFELSENTDIKYIYLFAGIALLVLLLAIINYINLAVTQSMKRTKEVGLRQVFGAYRWQLIIQFMSESILMSLLALCLALILSSLALPLFNMLIEYSLDLSYLQEPQLLAMILGSALFAGFISGSYLAFFATRLKLCNALTDGQAKGSTKSKLRNLLIIGQFVASIILVTGSLVIYQQLQYIQSAEMGYDREHILTISIQDHEIIRQFDTIRQELLKNPRITHVAVSYQLPNNINAQTVVRGWEGSTDSEAELPIYIAGVGYDFVDLYDLDIKKGRNFSRQISSDTTQGSYLVNETAVKALGWDEDSVVGKTFSSWGGDGYIVGVVKDFHMHSLHMNIQPLAIFLDATGFRFMSLKLQPSSLQETVDDITRIFSGFSDYPVAYSFMDDVFNQQYNAEIKLGKIVRYFTLLALFLTTLGVFGLTAFSAEQRTKEIGVRKVLGASVTNIVVLLTKDFIKLVGIGFIIAVPIGWYGMNRWLENFAYRIEIGPGVFALAGIAALAIALLTVSWQSVKAAVANPVESLRSE